MKKNIFSLFLLLVLVMIPFFRPAQVSAQSAVQNVGCTVIKVPPILKLGSKGSEVTKLQNFLIASGYLTGTPATSYFGYKTKAALIQFQLNYGLKPDGVVGAITSAFIKNLTCNSVSTQNNSTTINTNTTNTNTTTTNTNTTNTDLQNSTNTNTTNTNTTNTNQVQNLSVACNTNTAPLVEVDTPNGGEVYNNTDFIKIAWSTCNIPTDAKVKIILLHANDIILTTGTTNTGGFGFQLSPTLIMNPQNTPSVPVAFDNLFKIQLFVTTGSNTYTDTSDNNFSILDPNITTPNNPGTGTNANTGWPLGCVWPLTVFNTLTGQPCTKPLVGTNPTIATDLCMSSNSPHVVVAIPNGGEKFTIGSSMDVMWFNCNIPTGVDIQISLVQNTSTGTVQYLLVKQTPNDGTEQVKLVPVSGSPALVPGSNYQLKLDFVLTSSYTGPANPTWLQWGTDLSDAFFTLVQ